MNTEEIKLINEEALFENANPNFRDVLIATDEGMSIAEHQDEEIKILGVEDVIEGDGQIMTVVSVEVEGEPALLIDINSDDVMAADANFPYIHHDDLMDYTNDADLGTVI